MPKTRKRLSIAAATAGLAAAATIGAAGTGFAAPWSQSAAPVDLSRGAIGNLYFSPRFARSEVVVVAGGVPHAIRFDRGRVTAVSSSTVTLLERDGTFVTIPISPSAAVRVNGRPAALANVRRGSIALAVRDGDRPAESLVAGSARRG